jgi:hypothetical protein
VVRVGERVLIKRVSLRVLQRILPRLGLTFTQQLVGRMISRWLPVVGAASIAAYVYYDTVRVGKTVINLFGRDLEIEGDEARELGAAGQ